jgi:hypothetical protein
MPQLQQQNQPPSAASLQQPSALSQQHQQPKNARSNNRDWSPQTVEPSTRPDAGAIPCGQPKNQAYYHHQTKQHPAPFKAKQEGGVMILPRRGLPQEGFLDEAATTTTTTTTTKPTAAHPVSIRRDLVLPPRGIGPVHEPNHHDVLCVRGDHNVLLRELVAASKAAFLSLPKQTRKGVHCRRDCTRHSRQGTSGAFSKEGSRGWWSLV